MKTSMLLSFAVIGALLAWIAAGAAVERRDSSERSLGQGSVSPSTATPIATGSLAEADTSGVWPEAKANWDRLIRGYIPYANEDEINADRLRSLNPYASDYAPIDPAGIMYFPGMGYGGRVRVRFDCVRLYENNARYRNKITLTGSGGSRIEITDTDRMCGSSWRAENFSDPPDGLFDEDGYMNLPASASEFERWAYEIRKAQDKAEGKIAKTHHGSSTNFVEL